MPIGNQYGALGATFQVVRVFQIMSMIAIIGMTANFISNIVSNNLTAPSELIGTLSVTCIAVLYCVLTSILFLDNILSFLVSAIMDLLLLVAVIVVAVILGKPLSYLKCSSIGQVSGDDSSAYAYAAGLNSYLATQDGTIVYDDWIGASKSTCLEMKSIWGLSIGLCILFAFSLFCSLCLWKQKKALANTDADGKDDA